MVEGSKDITPRKNKTPRSDTGKNTQERNERVTECAKAITGINKKTPPEDAVRLIREWNMLTGTPESMVLDQIEAERLRRAGQNPGDWTFYTWHSIRADQDEFQEDELKKYADKFPDGIEFFVLQGQAGYRSDIELRDYPERPRIEDYPGKWRVYVRVRPEYPRIDQPKK